MSDKPKLTKLEQFPCPYCDGPTKTCKPDCLAALGGVDTNCQVVDIYRKAITDNKCARLLRVFAGRWLDVVSRAYLAVSDPSFRNWTNLSHLTGSIHKALRDAGL